MMGVFGEAGMPATSRPSAGVDAWIFVNQSQNLAIQRILERICDELGPCRLLTGTPFIPATKKMAVLAGPVYDRRSIRTRVLSWIRFSMWAGLRMFGASRTTLVVATTNPPILPAITWLGSLVRGYPFVLYVWDVYPDHLVQSAILGEGHLLVQFWKWLNRRTLSAASTVVTLTESMADRLEDGSRRRVAVVPLSVDTDRFIPREKRENRFAVRERLVERTVLLYSGNIGATHGLDVVADAVPLLSDVHSLAVVIVGDGLGLRSLRDRAKDERIRFIPRQDEDVLPEMLAVADIGLVTQAAETGNLSMPSKLLPLLAVGATILAVCPSDSDLAKLVWAEGVGLAVEPGNPQAIAAAVRRLALSAEFRSECSARARALAVSRFSVGVVCPRLSAILLDARAQAS